jgi:hypothetical protein
MLTIQTRRAARRWILSRHKILAGQEKARALFDAGVFII